MKRRHFCQSSLAAAVALSLGSQQALASLGGGLEDVSADIQAVTGGGAGITLPRASVKDLADGLRGQLLLPGNEAYEQARQILNPSFDRYPALVVQPAGPADVSRAVQFAAQENMLVAVKCGGHSASGKSTCDGGMLIDLSSLRSVRIDPVQRTAWVAGGSLLAELDHESMAYGLVTTAGTVSHTGVGGLTLGGGFGRLGRRFGLTIDNLRSVDIVTADGRLLRASAAENPDLFWGVRGGGGNFGVVTAFEFQLHPMNREVLAGSYHFPFSEARQVLNFMAEYAASAPDELNVGGGLFGEPGGEPSVSVSVVYSGPPEQAEALFAPISKAGTVLRDTVKPWDYVALQKSGDIDDPRANGSYMKSGFIRAITPDLVEDLAATFQGHPGRRTWMGFQQSGGAISRVPGDATAFPNRDASHNLLSFVGWPVASDPGEHVAYIKNQWSVIERHTGGFYTNDMFDQTQANVSENYGQNFMRLVAVKNRYDPGNLFRLNANIKPTV